MYAAAKRADIGVTATGVTLIDPEVSDEIALRGAAVMGFREAAEAAKPEFLEPIMKLEITTPPESVGEVLGDLNGRRGTVLDMEQRSDMQVVHARVPMAQMFGYATAIRSLTKGRASYSMEPDSFDLVPRNMREELLARSGHLTAHRRFGRLAPRSGKKMNSERQFGYWFGYYFAYFTRGAGAFS